MEYYLKSFETRRSTRICVKNVPRHVDEQRLREHFASQGEVTDAKIIRTSDGRSRQFGFIGYRTEEEAHAAVKYFHRTFLDTSRLSCEVAQAKGASSLPRPWSRHSQGSSAYSRSHISGDERPADAPNHAGKPQTVARNGDNPADDNDPLLQEFLQVMQPRANTKIWGNDTTRDVDNRLVRVGVTLKKSRPAIEVRTVEAPARRVPINKGKTSTKLTQLHFRFADEDDLEKETLNITDEAEAYPQSRTARHEISRPKVLDDLGVSDADYLKSKIRAEWSDSEGENVEVKVEKEKEEEEEEECHEVGEQGHADGAKSDVLLVAGEDVHVSGQNPDEGAFEDHNGDEQESVDETGRLFVRNLPYTASEEDLGETFSKFGRLSEVHLVLDKATKRSKGFAYILYMIPEDASRALKELDKSIFQGRLLHIIPAKRPLVAKSSNLVVLGPGGTKYKQEREAQRKSAEANGDRRAWNMLFMRTDTVAENIAQKYGMSKSDFLDPEAEDLAVRMALGETHIITETKRALSREGVNVETLEQVASGDAGNVKRSNHIILVKNLPFTVTEDDLLRLFAPHGSIGRLILPPTKTLAVVEYLEAAEASRAFKSLAYKRFQHVPLYLEWAPDQLLRERAVSRPNEGGVKEIPVSKGVGTDFVKSVELSRDLIALEDDLEATVAPTGSVFVKNLNFSTTPETLKKHFQSSNKLTSIRSVKISTKPQKKGGKPLSLGFGFVEFDSVETANEVCKQFQGTVLEGHALVLQLSHGCKKGDSSSQGKEPSKLAKNESSTKLIVRNVAFEATKKDLHQLFNPFGQLKSLKLPKKFDGTHRGFAFVEFLTRQEAQDAFDGLKNTHLYGRHLVLERAKITESLDELRARTSQRFFVENGVELGPRKTKASEEPEEVLQRPRKMPKQK